MAAAATALTTGPAPGPAAAPTTSGEASEAGRPLFPQALHLEGQGMTRSLRCRVLQSPLAGVSDRIFRGLVRRWAPDALLFTEMVNATSLELGHGRIKVEELAGETGPIGVQLFDHRPDAMAEAARRAEASGAFLIDINMGCPVQKIARKGGGSGQALQLRGLGPGGAHHHLRRLVNVPHRDNATALPWPCPRWLSHGCSPLALAARSGRLSAGAGGIVPDGSLSDHRAATGAQGPGAGQARPHPLLLPRQW